MHALHIIIRYNVIQIRPLTIYIPTLPLDGKSNQACALVTRSRSNSFFPFSTPSLLPTMLEPGCAPCESKVRLFTVYVIPTLWLNSQYVVCPGAGSSDSPDLELRVPFDLPLTGYRKQGNV